MKKQKSKIPKKKIQDQTHDTLPASVGLVKEVRDELRASIRQVEHEIRSVEHGLNSKIEQVNSKIEQVLISVHHSQVLMEEQRGENRIVLDGIKNIFERQDRIETDFDELRGTVKVLSLGAKR